MTNDAVLARPDFLRLAECLLAHPVALHIRGPRTNGRTLFGIARTLSSRVPGAKAQGRPPRLAARLYVNDRVDIALALPLDGVHLGARSLAPAVVRSLLDDRASADPHPATRPTDRMVLGLSKRLGHSAAGRTTEPPAEVTEASPAGRINSEPAAEAAGAAPAGRTGARSPAVKSSELRAVPPVDECMDYVFAGSVFSTASHPHRPGAGLSALAESVTLANPTPVVAIGGITPPKAPWALAAGAHGVAVLSGVWDTPDPEVAVSAYLESLGVRDLGSAGGEQPTNPTARGPS